MTKREELNAFIARADEFLDSKYILANVKLVNLLKTIAASETLMAIFKSCLTDFNYIAAKEKYLVKNEINEGKGEFVFPTSSRDFLALTFSLLIDIDGGKIDLGDFIDKYFYENGSLFEGYAAFLKTVVKPFKSMVVSLMDSVIEGRIQDPVEAVMQEENKRKEEKEREELKAKKQKELSSKTIADSVKAVKAMLNEDKKKIADGSMSLEEKTEANLIIDMLNNVIETGEKEAITYAFVSYKYLCKAYIFKFRGRMKAVEVEIQKIIKE